jgi:hypothetical protein
MHGREWPAIDATEVFLGSILGLFCNLFERARPNTQDATALEGPNLQANVSLK